MPDGWTPIVNDDGETIGWIVVDERGSHFRQAKNVPAGALVNYGLTTAEPQGNVIHRPI